VWFPALQAKSDILLLFQDGQGVKWHAFVVPPRNGDRPCVRTEEGRGRRGHSRCRQSMTVPAQSSIDNRCILSQCHLQCTSRELTHKRLARAQAQMYTVNPSLPMQASGCIHCRMALHGLLTTSRYTASPLHCYPFTAIAGLLVTHRRATTACDSRDRRTSVLIPSAARNSCGQPDGTPISRDAKYPHRVPSAAHTPAGV
jgi:hypothetical protein